MKKLTCLFLISMLLLTIAPMVTNALTEGSWIYKIVDNEIIITNYIGSETTVVMPSEIRGCPVVKIELAGDYYSFKQIKKITLPDSIREIAAETFYTPALESVNIPKNLEILGHAAFRNCSITSIDLSVAPNLRTIGAGTFYGCQNLITVVLPNNLTEIPNSCFSSCRSLQQITFPPSVTRILRGAFSNCDFRGTLVFPSSIKEIHCEAFSGNDNLEEVIIPHGATFLSWIDDYYNKVNNKGAGPFTACDSLRAVYLPDTIENVSHRIIEYSDNCIVYFSQNFPHIDAFKENEVSYLIDNSVNSKIHVLYNGARVSFHAYGQNPEIINDRTMVPLRSIFEVMGASVEWDDTNKTATATRNGNTISIKIGENCIYKNGKAIPVDVPAQIINDRTMIPVRVIAEAFGANVEWQGNVSAVLITE